MNPLQWMTHLSREARDSVFLLAVIALTVVPLTQHLPVWCSGLMGGILLWRAWLAVGRKTLPPRWLLAAMLALSVGATWWQFRTLLGRDPGVTLIVILLGLKTLEWYRRRDAFVVFFLAFFALLTNFLYSQSLPVALYMVGTLWAWLTALVLMHQPVGRPSIAGAARTSAAMSLLGAPVVVMLFVLFPRFAPLWTLPTDSSARSGLSSIMEIGHITSLALDDAVAMRVQWLDPVTQQPVQRDPPKKDLYFRGPVLSAFDGRQWQVANTTGAMPSLQILGEPLAYQITLEPHHMNALLTLDVAPRGPQQLTGMDTRVTPQGQWLSTRNVDSLTRYTVVSYPRYLLDAKGQSLQIGLETFLPFGLNPRTSALGNELRNANPQASARELAMLVLERLRTGGYAYTLDPGEYGTHSADEFWFERKRGFCEHIAASFVILMRSMKVPARVVTGYQGGERNPVDGVWTVRQSDAHAWAEVWQSGEGWIRVDPTAAVSPERIGELTRLVRPPGFVASMMTGVFPSGSMDALQYLRSTWEAVNNVWNEQILSFNQNQQLKLLENIGFDAPRWDDLVKLLGWVLSGVALTAALLSRPRRTPPDPWLKLLKHAENRLQSLGMPTGSAHATPAQLAQLARSHWGDEAQAVANWLIHMQTQRYAKPSEIDVVALEHQYRQLSWPATTHPTATPS